MKTIIINRARLGGNPVWLRRKGLRAPAVSNASQERGFGVDTTRGVDRAAQAMAVMNKTTVQ